MITQQQRDLRNAVINLLRNNLTDEPDEHVDALILVLGSVIEGVPIDRAMGAPGDWGYGTPIGDALLAQLQSRP